MKRLVYFFVVVALIFGVVACQDNDTHEPQKNEPPAPVIILPPETLEEIVVDINDYCNSDAYKKDNSALSNPSDYYNDINVIVNVEAEKSIIIQGDAPKGSIMGVYQSISKILRYCTKYSDYIDDIVIVVSEIKADKYGNDHRVVLYMISFKMEELLKVNWDNFDYQRLKELSYEQIWN